MKWDKWITVMSTSNRPTSQKTSTTVAFPASVKIGSTAEMMKGLTSAQFNVPEDNVPKSVFIGITIAAVTLRQTQKHAQEHPGQIQSTMSAIQNQLDHLQTLDSRSAREAAQNFTASIAPNLADGSQRLQQRKEFEKNVNELVRDSNVQITEVVTAMIDVTTATDADVQALFANIKKKIDEVVKQEVQLSRNDVATQYSLDSVLQKITLELNNERRKLGITVTEEMFRPEQK